MIDRSSPTKVVREVSSLPLTMPKRRYALRNLNHYGTTLTTSNDVWRRGHMNSLTMMLIFQ
jgi:hypothetical protein